MTVKQARLQERANATKLSFDSVPDMTRRLDFVHLVIADIH